MQNANKLIIAVDCDGTLLRGDSFLHACAAAFFRRPLVFVWRALNGPAPLKWWMYRFLIDGKYFENLQFNEELIAWLHARQKIGDELILVSAAPGYYLDELQKRVGEGKLFSATLGSTLNENLRGAMKAQALVARYGAKNFDYVGNSQSDVAVWRVCNVAYNVNPSRGLQASAAQQGVALLNIARNPQHRLMEGWDVFKRFILRLRPSA